MSNSVETPYVLELARKRSPVRFENRQLEAEYRAHVALRSERNTRRQLLVALAMIAGLAGLDQIFSTSEVAAEATRLRLIWMVPGIALLFALTFVRRGLWLRQIVGVYGVFSVAAGAMLISELQRRSGQPVVAVGHFVGIVFTFFFMGLWYWVAVVTAALAVASYVGFAFAGGNVNSVVAAYSVYNLAFLSVICAFGAAQLELARRRDFLMWRILSFRSDIDALSQLANRRAFDRRLEEAWDEAAAQRKIFAVMLFDIDHFKAYNDHYGHQAGDRAIKRVAEVLKRHLQRPQDFVARYGGEEFAAILIDAPKESILALAEKIRTKLLEEGIEHARSGAPKRVTVSIGLAYLLPHDTSRSRRGVVHLADQALYEAKERGRNRVVDAANLVSHTATGMFKPMASA